jgi:hypothetical protein
MPPKTKTKEQLKEEFRQTHPCRECGMSLVESADTLGHTPAVCARYKAEMAKKAAGKPSSK